MTVKKTILYPTRGGQTSHANQDAAIALAKEKDANLVFLYVSSVQFLERLGHLNHATVVENELEDMGEFLLAMACERAEKAGWQADPVVRQGAFSEALLDVIEEYAIDTVVLGAPGASHAVTTMDFLQNLTKAIQAAHDIEVILIQDGNRIDLSS